jgi:hypothetical protein
MKEAEWLEGTDPRPMLRFLRGRASQRKLLLFAAACCWRIRRQLTVEGSRKAIRVLERYADGLATFQEYVWGAVHGAGAGSSRPAGMAVFHIVQAARYCPSDRGFEAAWAAAKWIPSAAAIGARRRWTLPEVAEDVEGAEQCRLLRELFGNPFRFKELDAETLRWNGGAIPQLAQVIYERHDFKRMLALGDLLERAGSSNASVLSHCRQTEEHALGCWVIDLALGKV